MQYGEAGHGLHGENCFIGTWDNYRDSMREICGELKDVTITHYLGATGSENEVRLQACVKRVFQRWEKRDIEGWCEFCGKGGKELLFCGGCNKAVVRYCCKEHQKMAWKFHKFTCERGRRGVDEDLSLRMVGMSLSGAGSRRFTRL